MVTKKKLSEMTLDELYAEKKHIFDAFFNSKSLIVNLIIVVSSVLLAIYAMKDTFSYILMGLILWLIYSVAQKFAYKYQIDKEIKSRNK